MLSVVLPCYFESDNIDSIYNQLKETISGLKTDHEIIFIDDGSTDQTYEKIRLLAEKDPHVKGIKLSRNFGHQLAIIAGLNEAAGDRIVIMDADGQHPPEVIPELIKRLEEGYDIVNTTRLDSRYAGFFKKVSAKFFYRMFNLLSDVKIIPLSDDFRIMNRKALNAFLSFDEQSRFTRGLIRWMGFRQATITYTKSRRESGKSKFTLKKMRNFAIDGVISFSTKPLRISTVLGLIILLFGFLYAVYALVVFALGRTIPGWTSLLITILLMGGVQLFSIGIIGEYIAKIYNESKKRPHYFIEERTDREV